MSLDTIVWVSVMLFLVHEFEEIIRIRPWIVHHRGDPRARRQGFWGFSEFGTPTIAAMIFEEFLLFAALALIATLWRLPGMFAGLLVVYALHLVGHIAEAVRLRMQTPSVISSVCTLPWYVIAIVELSGRSAGVFEVGMWSVVFAAIMVANFALIYRLRPWLESRLPEGASRG